MSEATHELKVDRNVAVDCEQVFAAFTQADHLSRWFTKDARVDLRVGGRYSNADGDKGEFLEIDPPNRVRFTWDNEKHCPETEVDVSFECAADDRTRIRLVHSGLASEKAVAEMREGWTWALDSLASYLETGKPITFENWQQTRR